MTAFSLLRIDTLSPGARSKPFPRRLGALLAIALASALSAPANVLGSQVQISGASPFGVLADCGNFPSQSGSINFVDSEVEPWIDVNPADADNIVAIWQQDRWSDGGSRGNVAGVSSDGGSSWAVVPWRANSRRYSSLTSVATRVRARTLE